MQLFHAKLEIEFEKKKRENIKSFPLPSFFIFLVHSLGEEALVPTLVQGLSVGSSFGIGGLRG
jgi:hypothetical protein